MLLKLEIILRLQHLQRLARLNSPFRIKTSYLCTFRHVSLSRQSERAKTGSWLFHCHLLLKQVRKLSIMCTNRWNKVAVVLLFNFSLMFRMLDRHVNATFICYILRWEVFSRAVKQYCITGLFEETMKKNYSKYYSQVYVTFKLLQLGLQKKLETKPTRIHSTRYKALENFILLYLMTSSSEAPTVNFIITFYRQTKPTEFTNSPVITY